jgi:hypothetical protein
MRKFFLIFCMALLTASAVPVFAQAPAAATDNPDLTTVYCDFADGKEVSAEYIAEAKEEPHNGKVWVPGGQPITLFTQTPLTVGGKDVPPAAYTIYILPEKKEWTLIVSKNTSLTTPYDQKDDLARASMDLGELQDPLKVPQVSLAHTAPKTCNLRVSIGKVGAFVDFIQK